MNLESHYRKLENMYHNNHPLNKFYNAVLTVSEGIAELRMPTGNHLFHALGAVHGSVLFKLLDDATFFSANSLDDDAFKLTGNFTTYFLRPVANGELYAKGQVVYRGRSQIIAEGVVYNDESKEIARGSGTFVKSKVPLTKEIGYQL